MDTDSVITKAKADYRIKKVEIQGKKVIDSIIITYDDGSVWSYGLGGGKSNGKTIMFAKNEYLVRVTHETLVNQRWAGAALELETSRGRIFSFEPVCSRTPKHKRTTITAAPGMELLSLKIKSGALVGFEQQPCSEKSSPDGDWYSILYQSTKEGADGAEVREFSEQEEAASWWNEISDRCKKKAGRGAVYIDTKRNTTLQKAGSEELTIDLIRQAEKRGLYLNMKEHAAKLSISALFTAISKALLTRQYTIRMIVVTALILSHKFIDLEMLNLTGKLISILSDSTTSYNQSLYGQALCQTVLKCEKESRFDHTRAMLTAFVLMVILERVMYLTNVFVHVRGFFQIMGSLRTKSLEKALFLHQGYHDSHTSSEVNCMSNVDNVSRLVTWNFPYAFAHLIGILASGFYLVRANLMIGGGVVFFIGLLYVFYLIPQKRKTMKLHRCRRKLAAGAEDLKNEAVNMISTVKQFSQEALHVEKQRVAENGWVSCEMILVLNRIQNEFVEHAFKYLLLAIMIGYELVATTPIFGPGEFLTFFIIYGKFQDQFMWFSHHLEMLEEDLSAVESYLDFMSTPSEVVSGEDVVCCLEEDIQLENVHFGYPTRIGEKVFSGLDLKIQRKKMTAIVGDSGSGKTTLAKLIMRLYDPQQGRITIGGKDIRTFDLTKLHGKMSIVSQNPSLLNTTLVENVSYGAVSRDQITMKRVQHAAELANCDFINKFRSGMDTFAGAQGLQLSGGQKQRIAIARAAMRDPEILILDEATSALDAQNEKEVQEALDKLMKGKTTIVIAHRLSTIRHADEIICLKDGEVKERGTHEELMELGKYYATLVSKQLVEDTCNKIKENKGSEDAMKNFIRQASQELITHERQSRLSKAQLECNNYRDLTKESFSISNDEPLFGDSELDLNEKNFGPPKE